MAKFAILDDTDKLAMLVREPLEHAGHEVLVASSPVDFEQVMNFGPEVISVHLYRAPAAYDRAIDCSHDDIQGMGPLEDMERYPAVNVLPIMLVGACILAGDVKTSVKYDLFLSFPEDIGRYVTSLESLASMVKSSRKISGYVCPACASRLTFSKYPAKDLFCPRCHLAVAVVTGGSCFMMGPSTEGKALPCRLEETDGVVAIRLADPIHGRYFHKQE